MSSRATASLAVAVVMVIASCGGDTESSTADDGSVPAQESIPTRPETDPTVVPTESPATEPESTAPETTRLETTSPEATMAPSTEPETQFDFSAIGPIVSDFIDERGLNGAGLVVVDAEDGIVHEDYWGEFGPDRVSLVASSSKMITAGVLLRLADDGLLDMDAPVADVVEWGSGNPEITPAQLVSNSSGLVGLLPNPAYGPYLCQFAVAGTLQDCSSSIFTTPADDADVIAPDTEFRYGGAQWQVAGAVAEAVSGRSWGELIEEIYVEPCGVDSLGYNNHFTQINSGVGYPTAFGSDPTTLAATDNPNMEGGAYISAPDYAELLLMHLRGGECENGTVLSERAVDRMHADRIADVYGGSARADTGYGMGWWVDRESGRISDGGAYGSVPWLDLDAGHGAYLVIEADAETGNELAALLYEPVAQAVGAG